MPRRRARKDDEYGVAALTAAAELLCEHLAPSRRLVLADGVAWMTRGMVTRRGNENRRAAGKRLTHSAIDNRWDSFQEFVIDAVIWVLSGTDQDIQWGRDFSPRLIANLQAAPASVAHEVAKSLFKQLIEDPRTFLMPHLGQILHNCSPEDITRITENSRRDQRHWEDAFGALLTATGARLRPGWDPQRAALALQALLDGMLVRTRAQALDYAPAQPQLFADTVIAFVLGVLDLDQTGETPSETLARRWAFTTDE